MNDTTATTTTTTVNELIVVAEFLLDVYEIGAVAVFVGLFVGLMVAGGTGWRDAFAFLGVAVVISLVGAVGWPVFLVYAITRLVGDLRQL